MHEGFSERGSVFECVFVLVCVCDSVCLYLCWLEHKPAVTSYATPLSKTHIFIPHQFHLKLITHTPSDPACFIEFRTKLFKRKPNKQNKLPYGFPSLCLFYLESL